MTLTEQDRMVDVLRQNFGQGVDAVHDLRNGSHSGYRAVHLWVRLDSPRGAWFEVQFRTRLQGVWANAYEALADIAGRGIRYGEDPIDPAFTPLVGVLQRMSLNAIARTEHAPEGGDSDRFGQLLGASALTGELVGLGLEPATAAQSVSEVLRSTASDATSVRSVVVHLVSTVLSEFEASVRSLSDKKGE
jgi:hypothetical protein